MKYTRCTLAVSRQTKCRIIAFFIIALVVAFFIPSLTAAALTSNEAVIASWKEQFSELSSHINEKKNVLGKSVIQEQEKVLDRNSLIFDTDRDPTDVVIRRTAAMIAGLSKTKSKANWKDFESRLEVLKQQHETRFNALGKTTINSAVDATYFTAQELNREVMFASAALDFTDLIFIERGILTPGIEYDGEHMCDQFFGHNGRTGGGMFILKNFATTPQKVNIMNGVTVPSGTNKGKLMSTGTFLSPELSYDGKTIYFAWSSGGHDKWVQANRYNLFKINIDGTGITRLTDGNYDDMHPCCLPSGRIAFISTRRGGYGRCHERIVPSYTLCSMKSDGSDIIFLSYHETNEYHPAVLNDGRILFTRWDYIDRDFSAAHHIWICNPDGTNPRANHGNYATPYNTITSTGPFSDGRVTRPFAEYNARPIPGSTKIIAIAGPHHGQSYGSIVLIDQDIPDDGKMSQVTRVTPDAGFPESEVSGREYKYGTPWPISESQYLANYNSTLILLDKSGSKQVLYTTTSDQYLRPQSPIPVKERTVPPNLPVKTYQGERHTASTPQATISIMNVYATDAIGKLPSGSKVKQLRIMQVLPKTTPLYNDPLIGTTGDDWGGGIARFPLGVVPVEDDGSAYFEAPVAKEIYFQLLDSNGCAIQSMRSGTYVHSGEQMSCYGCHEDKWQALPPLTNRKALSRPPSKITAEFTDQYPFGFYRNVKPVFQNTCLSCHNRLGKGLQNMDYISVVGPQRSGWNDLNVESKRYGFFFTGGAMCTIYLHQGSRTLPGRFGARESRMGKALFSSTHQAALKDGTIKDEDFRKVILWLDGNCDELGSFNRVADQKAGKRVWPDLDVDSLNPTGVEPGTPNPVIKYDIVANAESMSAVIHGRLLVVKGFLQAATGPCELSLFDCSGHRVATRSFGKSSSLSIDMTKMARGSYIVRLNAYGVKTQTAKVCYW
jgi:hypothetical protein